MRITTTAQQAMAAIEQRAAKVTADIAAAEMRAHELEPQAELSAAAKQALAAIRKGTDRAKQIRDSLAAMDRSLRGVAPEAAVELNENECNLFGYVDLR